MKIALFGATGTIGRRIAQEALARGHELTAIVRDPARLDVSHECLTAVKGDVLDAASVAAAVKGHDAVISAYGPGGSAPPRTLVDAAPSLIEGLGRAAVRRLVVVGGAGSLEVAPGVQLVDTPGFPAAWKPAALAHRDALAVYRTADLDWTYVSPAALIAPGERTGRFRIGTDRLVIDDKGESRISAEDYAVALLDEVERPQFIRRRMTVGY
jgi:putative NADH-flavin reductase